MGEKSLRQISIENNINYETVKYRVKKKGMCVEGAVKKPVNPRIKPSNYSSPWDEYKPKDHKELYGAFDTLEYHIKQHKVLTKENHDMRLSLTKIDAQLDILTNKIKEHKKIVESEDFKPILLEIKKYK